MRTLLLVCSIVGWLAACVVSSNETLITTFSIYNPQYPQYTYFPSIFEGYNINDCVPDTLSVDGVLLNSSLTYDQKVRLFTSKISHACPFLQGNPFFSAVPTLHFDFTFSNSRSSLWSNETAGEPAIQCGLACNVTTSATVAAATAIILPGVPNTFQDQTLNQTRWYNSVTGQIIRSTSVIANFTRVTCNVFNSSLETGLLFPQGFDDGVCTAYIQYNTSYWENATVFAAPRNFTVLFTESLIIGQVPTNITFQLPYVSTCPVYLTEPVNVAQSSLYYVPRIFFDVSFGSTGNIVRPSGVDVALTKLQCEVVGGVAVIKGQLGVSETDHFFSWILDQGDQPATSINISSMTLVYWGASIDLNMNLIVAPSATIQVLPGFSPGNSSWTPFVDYSSATWAHNSSRCYTTTPRAADGTITTLMAGLSCSIKNRYYISLYLLNATAFCCDTWADSNSFVWPNYVQVELTRSGLGAKDVVWFVDTSGITPTMMTPAPATSSPGGTNNSNETNNTNATPTPGGVGRDDSSSSGGSGGGGTANVGAILGGTLSGVVVIVAAIVAYFYCVWKPRQDALEIEYAKNAASGATFTPLHLREMTVGLLREEEETSIDPSGVTGNQSNSSVLLGLHDAHAADNVSVEDNNVTL
ncbi:membrane-associated protein, putative [Bodo saltans]|uniref:Membrane-associated protein, putative n=1 Tax=Bodo saltans TaxID=75058 RepID=A0A0S4J2P3_BODSA|nr:membrane-associated protein, putative [Bodo saltans]|eukprot:CUG85216.1 membrane-associated protein, putative [Bodo saltans]